MKKTKTEPALSIRSLYPEIDGGKYPAKTELDRDFIVDAELTAPADRVSIRFRLKGEKKWKLEPMTMVAKPGLSSHYQAVLRMEEAGIWEYTLEVQPKGNGSFKLDIWEGFRGFCRIFGDPFWGLV